MNENEGLKFKAVDEDGRTIDCEALFCYQSPETKKNYIAYTDHSIDEEGNTRVYASIYEPEDLKSYSDSEYAALPLKPIETEREWETVETILQEMQKQVESADSSSAQ